eukprot:c7390_g1_i1.p1 GENE.c7390_g1_i1~~c7390_g1_i1.p1  ORF type:complete len:635 (+),score=155.80 c7390_g1_i1:161-1906(+)
MTGFTGSSGTAVVCRTEALLWTDGRYFLQAEHELSSDWKLMRQGIDLSLEDWFGNHIPDSSKIGVDSRFVSSSLATTWNTALAKKASQLVDVQPNPIDEIWNSIAQGEEGSRPPLLQNTVFALPVEFSGESVTSKISRVRAAMNANKPAATVLILTALDEVCWLFNLRGSDVPYNPVFPAYALLTPTECTLFANYSRFTPEAVKILEESQVQLRAYEEAIDFVTTASKNQVVWADAQFSSWKINQSISGATSQVSVTTPVTRFKAVKNSFEIEGMKRCHARDAVAVIEMIRWLETAQILENGDLAHPDGGVMDEIRVASYLESQRQTLEHFRGLSFATICGSGSNGAIIHYHAKPDTSRAVNVNQMLLIDSGGQYLDGTTDITRTIHLGQPSPYERDCFTRVLKGVISLSRVTFPEGISGYQLDLLARFGLWENFLDYRHGTGHGVGSFLNVHEGPHGISSRYSTQSNEPFGVGLVTSIEPGYYEDGKFGIRIENLAVCQLAKAEGFDRKKYLSFDTLTVVPIQAKLINPELLSPVEIAWIDKYHHKCRTTVLPLLSNESLSEWLIQNTRPLHEQLAQTKV